jgi:hypothetical protein
MLAMWFFSKSSPTNILPFLPAWWKMHVVFNRDEIPFQDGPLTELERMEAQDQ